jgi:hypothetical protein
MTTPPAWTHDAGDNAYTLISDNVRCRVWYTSLDTWAAAFFMHYGTSRAVYGFNTIEEAKAWCEQQAAKADR